MTLANFLNEVDSYEAALYWRLQEGQFILSPAYKDELEAARKTLCAVLDAPRGVWV